MQITETQRAMRTITLFFLAGMVSVGTLNLTTGGPFVRSDGDWAAILAIPSLHFAVFMYLAFFFARKRGLLLGWTDPSMRRAAVGSCGLALIYPMGIMVMLLAWFLFLMTFKLMGFSFSDSGNPTPPSYWQKRVDELSVVFPLLTGAVFTAFVSASTVRYIIGRRPRGFLLGLTVTAIGVPVATMLAQALMNELNFVERLMAPLPIVDLPLLLLIGQPVLGGVIGYWAHTAARQRIVGP